MMQQLHIEDYVPGQLMREYRRNTGPIKKVELEKSKNIEDLPTCDLPAVSPKYYDTPGLIARILSPQQEVFVEKCDSSRSTLCLIHEAAKELVDHGYTPNMIMLPKKLYLAIGEFILQPKYYYHDKHVPFVPAQDGCNFDVRVYGVTLQQ